MKRHILIYVAGPYSSNNLTVRDNYIANAERVSARLWELGFAVLCPHLNSRNFERITKVGYNEFIEGYLTILRRCDIAIFLPGWQKSAGCLRELSFCKSRKIPAVFNFAELWKEVKNLAN